jgi:multifunctional beta-oxidation protein
VGLIGLTRTLAREGTKYNIKTNVIVPVSYHDISELNRADGQLAATAMLATAMPPDMLKGLRPEFIAPFVGILTAKNVSLCGLEDQADDQGPDVNGRIFELAGGYYSELRYERSKGAVWKTDDSFTPSAVAAKWDEVRNFDGAEHPVNSEDVDMMVSNQAYKIRDVLIGHRACSRNLELYPRTPNLPLPFRSKTRQSSSPELELV